MSTTPLRWRVATGVASALLSILANSCAAGADRHVDAKSADTKAATEGMKAREDLEIVDCLLPGQVRQLGNTSYITQRRPTHTTAADCRIRGGEYVSYDRADLKSSLRVWMAAAEAGDAAAQNTVGEIYERGIGAEPNYEAAAIWYQKAADQHYSRALFNLGTLYEQGLGVPADKLKALNLYREAWGLPEDSVMYQSAAREEQASLRAELTKQLAEKDTQLKLLQKELTQMQSAQSAQTAQKPAEQTQSSKDEIEALKQWIARLESERRTSNERLNSLTALRTPTTKDASQPAQPLAVAPLREVRGMNFGRYYALVIGNDHYLAIDSLKTPISDAEQTAKILADKYGFTVRTLEDATDVAILRALNDLNKELKPDDNVLIYYAGHGARLSTGKSESGYWLPVNADAPPQDTFWVPNEQITAHLARLPAKRVLVVADSCYAGLLSTDPSYLFVDGGGGYSEDYVKFKLPKRSRLLLTSGGDQPVLDTGGGNHSVFARAFLDELQNNKGILPAPKLFADIRKRVEAIAASNKFVQVPEFKSIKGAGHELGDFFLVPKL